MTTNNKIMQALVPLNIPVFTNFNEGYASEYIVFMPADERGVDFGDDGAEGVVSWWQIQYFCPLHTNYLAKKKTIRNLLVGAGFTFPSVSVDNDEEHEYTRLIFECSIKEE